MSGATSPSQDAVVHVWRQPRRRWALFVCAMVLAIWGGRAAFLFATGVKRIPTEIVEGDWDLALISEGLDDAPQFRDTLKWWTGTWVGRVPFWRPLTSYGFWALWRVADWDNQRWWSSVEFVSYLGTCALLFLLMEAVTRDPRIAALSVAVFAPPPMPRLLDKFIAQPAFSVVGQWKNCPDQWMAMCALGAVLMAWRGRMIGAIVLAAMAAMFKESGFMAFPLVGVFFWYQHRRLPASLLGLAAVAALLAAIKLHAVGVGYVLGSNNWLWYRVWMFVAPEPLRLLGSPQAAWGVLAIGGALAIVCWRRRWIGCTAVAASAAIAMVVRQATVVWATGDKVGYDVIMAELLSSRMLLLVALPAMVCIVVAVAGLKGRWRGLVVLFWIAHLLMGLPSTFAPQVQHHAYYTAWLLASGATALCLWSLPVLWRPKDRPHPPEEESAGACSHASLTGKGVST